MQMGSLLTNASGSLWMSSTVSGGTASGTLYPTDGQGGTTTTAASSLTLAASGSRPIIVESVEVESVTTAACVVAVKDHGGTTLRTLTFPVSANSTRHQIGGAFGLRVNGGLSLVVTPGALGGATVHVNFRYPL